MAARGPGSGAEPMKILIAALALALTSRLDAALDAPRQTPGLLQARADVAALIDSGIPADSIRIAYVIEAGRLNTHAVYYPTPPALPVVVVAGEAVPAEQLADCRPAAIMRLR